MAAQVKGSAVLGLRSFLDDRGGAEARARLRSLLSPAEAAVIDESIPVGWYPLDAYVRAIGQVGAALGVGPNDGARAFGRYAADHDLSRFHRVFLRLANPAYVLEKAGEYWGRFYDSGAWTVTRETPTRARGELRGFAEVDATYCDFLLAYVHRMFELVGAKELRTSHPRCRASHAEACVFVGEWR